MNFISHGKSGCKIEIINKNFDFIIKKTSKSLDENTRHVTRINKQIDFYEKNEFSSIKTPQVLSLFEGSDSQLSYAEMRYVIGNDSLSFLKVANYNAIDNFIDQLFSYLDRRLEESYENTLYNNLNSNHIKLVLNKVDQIDKTLQFPRKDIIIKKLKQIPSDIFLNGECHGDFTLANMIHANGKLYVFDFLDMYVNSPVFDLLSIRQDTYHKWSCFIDHNYNCRIVELLNYIDLKLTVRYKHIISNNWYNYLSLMNYVRMYRMYDTTKKYKELDFIYDCITQYL